jgi:hypothetical protein
MSLMTAEHDEILDGLFHACAWRAYLEQAADERKFPPDSEATRRRAYRYYEDALAEKNLRAAETVAPTDPVVIAEELTT